MRKTKGLKCKKILSGNIESLEKLINDFLQTKKEGISLKHVRISLSKYKIDEKLKGNIIDFSLFYENDYL